MPSLPEGSTKLVLLVFGFSISLASVVYGIIRAVTLVQLADIPFG